MPREITGVYYTFYEIRVKGATAPFARFASKMTASVFLETWLKLRAEAGASTNDYEVVPVERREL